LSALVLAEGGSYERGLQHGRVARQAINFNVAEFWKLFSSIGISRHIILNRLDGSRIAQSIDDECMQYLKGLADGSKLRLQDIIALNTLKNNISPEECTVLIAMKDATATNSVIMLKNSDKIGSEKFTGPKFYNNKEINVVVFEKPDNGYKFAAVAAAGEASIKMGMNEKGVAAGSNISRTVELRQRKVNISQVRAFDRGWLIKEGIVHGETEQQASQLVLSKLIENPMSTPGNIEFVDAELACLIEGSYDRSAVQKVASGVAARSNRFVLLEELNDPEDVSSYARYIRALQLLNQNKGGITAQKMIEFSQDHENGPGPNSICRHSPDFRSETSLSAAVMEINPSNKAKSVFYVCLGKPCHAWRSKEGNLTIRMDSSVDDVPSGFRDGAVWKTFYTEQPAVA